jgi:uncharacterized protein
VISLVLALLCAARAVPALTGPVVDEARMIDASSQARLDGLARAARALKSGNGVQLQILTIPFLDDEPIEDFSIRVAESWKIGSKGADNGLLFVVAQTERKFRLEVGGGLEGDLTDIQAQHILDDTLTPAFRRGDYGGGLYAASIAALDAVHGLPQNVQAASSWSQPSRRAPRGFLPLLLWLLIGHPLALIFVLFLVFWLPRNRYGYYGAGGWSGGGGFSSGGSGGGWSGGGGGFSGGGASGGW